MQRVHLSKSVNAGPGDGGQLSIELPGSQGLIRPGLALCQFYSYGLADFHTVSLKE